MAELEAYHWPGNVRELRNVVERAVYRARGSRAADRRDRQFDPFHSPWAPTAVGPALRSAGTLSRTRRSTDATCAARRSRRRAPTNDFRGGCRYERALLEDALSRNRFNQRATAQR